MSFRARADATAAGAAEAVPSAKAIFHKTITLYLLAPCLALVLGLGAFLVYQEYRNSLEKNEVLPAPFPSMS